MECQQVPRALTCLSVNKADRWLDSELRGCGDFDPRREPDERKLVVQDAATLSLPSHPEVTGRPGVAMRRAQITDDI